MFLGGHDPASFGKVLIYSFETNQWRTLPNLSPRRHSGGVSLFIKNNGEKAVLVVGGKMNNIYYPVVETLDLKTETWSRLADYPMVSHPLEYL